MNLPKRIKVGGRWFRVRFPYLFKERTDVFGRADYNRGEVMITNLDQAGNETPETHTSCVFWHEIVHLIDWTYLMGQIGTEANKEDLIDALARGFHQVLADNYEPLKPLAITKLKGGKAK